MTKSTGKDIVCSSYIQKQKLLLQSFKTSHQQEVVSTEFASLVKKHREKTNADDKLDQFS